MADTTNESYSAFGFLWALAKLAPVLAISWIAAILPPPIPAFVACGLLHVIFMSFGRSDAFRFAAPWAVFGLNNFLAMVAAGIRFILYVVSAA